jgi:branched-subunit amino acid transport protein
MDTLTLWWVIIATGVATFASRLSFIAMFARREMPLWMQRSLRFVPPAVLTALIAPGLLLAPTGVLNFTLENSRLIAAGIAAVVAFRTRSTTWTMVAGMVALWVLQAVH